VRQRATAHAPQWPRAFTPSNPPPLDSHLQPNCFTQIVPHDGRKKIVIYAKRDIETGEELCYDYKFPIEDDESKKIVCRCGAQRCRGHMN